MKIKKVMAGMLAMVTVMGSLMSPLSAKADQIDAPYLALGADLNETEKSTVLSLLEINEADLSSYQVITVTNADEHKYLDSYLDSSVIGTRALSSVLIEKKDKGNGIKVTTSNITYCTTGMYQNALATAGISDANIIVAGPFALSGTAALVGTFEAYEKMTGETLDEDVVDAAMDELVTTGDLEQSIDGDSEDVEAMIADLKGKIANGELNSAEDIENAIDELADKYEINISDEDKQKITKLMEKLKGLDLDWGSIKDQAQDWADQLQNQLSDKDLGQKIADFFAKLWEAICSLFN